MGALGLYDPSTLLGTMSKVPVRDWLWVTLLYSTAVVCFGVDRIRRRKPPTLPCKQFP